MWPFIYLTCSSRRDGEKDYTITWRNTWRRDFGTTRLRSRELNNFEFYTVQWTAIACVESPYPLKKKERQKSRIVLSDDTDFSQLVRRYSSDEFRHFLVSVRDPVVRRLVEYPGRWLTSLPRTRWTYGFRRFARAALYRQPCFSFSVPRDDEEKP